MSQRTSTRRPAADVAAAIEAHLEGICAADPDVEQTSIVDGGPARTTNLRTTIPAYIRRHERLSRSDDLLIVPLPGERAGFIAVRA